MKGKDLIGIAGILLFAVTFAIDRLVMTIPNVPYCILVGLSLVLLVVGMVFANRRRKEP